MAEADFDAEGARLKQQSILNRARGARAILDRDVLGYYSSRNPRNQAEATENLAGLRRYVGRVYDEIRSLMDELEPRG